MKKCDLENYFLSRIPGKVFVFLSSFQFLYAEKSKQLTSVVNKSLWTLTAVADGEKKQKLT